MSPGHPTPRAVQPLGGEAPPFLTWKPPFASLTSVSYDGGAEEKEACISCVWSVTGKTRRRNLTFPHGHVDSAAPHRREGEEKKKKEKRSPRYAFPCLLLLFFGSSSAPLHPILNPPPPPPPEAAAAAAGGRRKARIRRGEAASLSLPSRPSSCLLRPAAGE